MPHGDDDDDDGFVICLVFVSKHRRLPSAVSPAAPHSLSQIHRNSFEILSIQLIIKQAFG